MADDEVGGGPAVVAAEEQPLVAERLGQGRDLVGERRSGQVEPQAAKLVLHGRPADVAPEQEAGQFHPVGQ